MERHPLLHVDADARDLAPAGPHAGEARDSAPPATPSACERGDQHRLELPQIPVQVLPVLAELAGPDTRRAGPARGRSRRRRARPPRPRRRARSSSAGGERQAARPGCRGPASPPARARPAAADPRCRSPAMRCAAERALQLEHLGVGPPAEVGDAAGGALMRPRAARRASAAEQAATRAERRSGRAPRARRARRAGSTDDAEQHRRARWRRPLTTLSPPRR